MLLRKEFPLKHLSSVLFLILLGIVSLLSIPDVMLAAPNQALGEIQLIESNAQHIVLELTVPSPNIRPRIVDGITYIELEAQGAGRMDSTGKPQLPIYGVLVALPQKGKNKVKVTQDRVSKEILAQPVLPSPRTRAVQTSPDELPQFVGLEYIPDTTTYATSALYPAERVSITSPAEWRSQRYIRVQLNPFQYNPVTRELVTHNKLRVEIDFGLSASAGPEFVGTTISEGSFEQILKQSLLNYESGRSWRSTEGRTTKLSRPGRAAKAGDSFKISVNADGIYQVTCDSLIAQGFDADNVNLDTLKLFFKGNQMAIDVVEDGDKKCEGSEYITFFGQAPSDYVIPYNVYWLTSGGENGTRMSQRVVVGGATPASYDKTLHLEQNLFYTTYAPFLEEADHWVWKLVNYPNNYTDTAVDLGDLAPGATNGILRVHLQSGAQANPYAVQQSTIFWNGTQFDQENWSSGTSLLQTVNVNNLTSGANILRIQDLPLTQGTFVNLNYIELDYQAQFIASSDMLRFRFGDDGLWNYQIQGFTNSNLAAFDITDSANVVKLNMSATPSGGTFIGMFSDQVSSSREYIALSNQQFQVPLSIVKDTPSNLGDPSNGADYIIITYGAWINNVQPLVDQRSTMGRVKVIDVEDVYDEFDYGMKNAEAIRSFLEYAYSNWQPPAPSYVLLIGNGNNDKGNNEPTYIPVYMKLVDPWLGMTASDHCLVTLDSPRDQCQLSRPFRNPLPSMAIGRLPALTASDVDNMVAKLLDYENITTTGTWRRKVMFITDNAYDTSGNLDPAGNFFAYSEEVAGDAYYLPAPLNANLERVYYNPCNGNVYPQCSLPYSTYNSDTAARNAVLAGIADGRLIVNYVGHGTVSGYAHRLLQYRDAQTLTRAAGDPKYPFLLPMTCLDGYFHSGYTTSIGEAMVRQAQGGVIGDFAPTGLGVAVGHDYLDRGFFEAITQNGKPRTGLAAVASKVFLYSNSGGGNFDLLDTFNLLGDPATLLQLPDALMPTPTHSPSSTPTRTNTPTLTNTPTRTPTFTGTPTNTPTATNTWDPGNPTWTPTATVTPSPTPTATLVPTDTETPTPPATLDPCAVRPAGPALVTPDNHANMAQLRIMLRWSSTDCVTRYKLVIKQGAKNGPVIQRATVREKTEFKTKALMRRQTFFWRVQACNAGGCRWSEWRDFKTR